MFATEHSNPAVGNVEPSVGETQLLGKKTGGGSCLSMEMRKWWIPRARRSSFSYNGAEKDALWRVAASPEEPGAGLGAQEGAGARRSGWLAVHREQTTNGALWSPSAV